MIPIQSKFGPIFDPTKACNTLGATIGPFICPHLTAHWTLSSDTVTSDRDAYCINCCSSRMLKCWEISVPTAGTCATGVAMATNALAPGCSVCLFTYYLTGALYATQRGYPPLNEEMQPLL